VVAVVFLGVSCCVFIVVVFSLHAPAALLVGLGHGAG
jgi:hypothetical protein